MWRNAWAEIRNYDAGRHDRLTEGWRPLFNDSATLTDRQYRDTVRARARDLERNSDIANGIISAYVRNVIGSGMNLQTKTSNEETNNRIEELFKYWSKPHNCDVTGVQTFNEMIQTIVQRRLVDGGILIYKTFSGSGLIPFQIQLIEVDELDLSAVNPSKKNNVIVDGVEKDIHGKVVGYHLRQYQADGTVGLESTFIPVKDMIFFYHKTRPSQCREISGLAQTIMRIRDITSYMEAVSMKERVAACLGVFITRATPGGTGLGRAGMPNKDRGFGGYDGVSLTPGMIQELSAGDDVKIVTPPNSGGGAADIVRLQQRLAAAGQGLSYETTSRDMSQVNYSSARQGLIEDEQTCSMGQDSLIQHVLKEIYETFVISAAMSGLLDMPDFFDREKKRDYLNHTWVPQGRKWIDPLKEANANKVALEKGIKTYQQVCLENGIDWREAIDDVAAAQDYAIEKGVTIFANQGAKV